MTIIVRGATIIDPAADNPISDKSILIKNGRIAALVSDSELSEVDAYVIIDATGKFVIPGLMNANVHLFGAITFERVAQHWNEFEDVILEAAQVTLKNGVTTVFDTWGPRRPLMAVRDRINRGEVEGSRFYCAGNIIGFDGLFSPDFFAKGTELASSSFSNKVNAIFVENTGRHLMWLSAAQVAEEIRKYIDKGIDFVKYASNDHGAYPGCFLAFAPRVQEAIVNEAHRAGITAQAHTHTLEGVQIAAEAGCDLLQHVNVTGPVPLSDDVLRVIVERQTGAVVFPWTREALNWIQERDSAGVRNLWGAIDTNTRKLIDASARILLATDGMLLGHETVTDPLMKNGWAAMPEEMSLIRLGTGHFFWMRAMEEKGFPPMEMLRAATRNIAIAYGKEADLGTLEPGKLADMLILTRNPFEAAANYQSIETVIKAGAIVDREALPTRPILTLPPEPPLAEEADFIPVIRPPMSFPPCALCMGR